MLEGIAPVMNQGQFGTCVGYAFAQSLAHGMLEKYGIPCKPEEIVSKIENLCWDGQRTESMPTLWNEKKKDYSFKNTDSTQRYTVHVDFDKLSTFEEAFVEMQRQKIKEMYMPCCITTQKDGHGLHSVALTSAYETAAGRKMMQAMNSWGSNQTFLDVTEDNFKYAITFDPIIIDAHQGEKPIRPLPKPLDVYLIREEKAAKQKAAAEAKVRTYPYIYISICIYVSSYIYLSIYLWIDRYMCSS